MLAEVFVPWYLGEQLEVIYAVRRLRFGPLRGFPFFLGDGSNGIDVVGEAVFPIGSEYFEV